MRHARRALAALGLLIALGLPARSHATVLRALSLEELARQADVIVLARVTRVTQRLVRTRRGLWPARFATLQVMRWIKGQGGAELAVREFGGRLPDGSQMELSGTPHYRAGELVMVFLSRLPEASSHGRPLYRTTGMAQGKLQWIPAVPGTQDELRRELREVTLARWQDGRMRLQQPAATERWPLQQLLRRIAAALASPAAPPSARQEASP